MSNRIVRVYDGEPGVSSVIGFSLSAYPDDPARLEEFLHARGYESRWMEPGERPEGSVSFSHVEARPPMTDQDVRALGLLCAKGEVDDEMGYPLIDGGNNGVYVIDNRVTLPSGPLQVDGALVAFG